MKYYDFEYEKKEQEKRDGKIKEEIHGDKKYLLKQALRYVVDATDDYGLSVELSHHEPLNYYIVSNYMPLKDDTETLDLSWMDSNDTIGIITYNKKHLTSIKKIIVNIDNLFCSNIAGLESVDIIIKNSKSNKNCIRQIKYFNDFFSKRWNLESINSIQFEGFYPKMEKILLKYAKYHYDNYNKNHSEEDKKTLIYVQ